MDEPIWICFDCGSKKGARIPEGHLATWHTDLCGICNEYKTVTQPRDFAINRHLITEDNEEQY